MKFIILVLGAAASAWMLFGHRKPFAPPGERYALGNSTIPAKNRVLAVSPDGRNAAIWQAPVPAPDDDTAQLAAEVVPASRSSGAPEAIVGQLRRVAALAAPEQRRAIERRLPFVYARAGDKAAALAALGALEAEPAGRDAEGPGMGRFGVDGGISALSALGPRDFFGNRAPDTRRALRFRVMEAIIDGQVKAGDKAGAARSADEMYDGLTKIENYQAPQNQWYVDVVEGGWLRAGKPPMPALTALFQRTRPEEQFAMLSESAAQAASGGDMAAADQALAAISDPGMRINACAGVGADREKAGAAAMAARYFKAALEQVRQTPVSKFYVMDGTAGLCILAQGRARTGDLKGAEQALSQVPAGQAIIGSEPTVEAAWADLGRAQWPAATRPPHNAASTGPSRAA